MKPVLILLVSALIVLIATLILTLAVVSCRALPWDPNIGEEAGEMDSFVKYLVMRLRNSLVEKSGHYALEPGPLPEVRNIPCKPTQFFTTI